ncbi:hypothetical protein P691DRAFT_805422 [Macrolepiota fuliginosa MF-IS2]|uniref:Secreted protein n=1 Tax=Macrolepiota fuliginosa MF-IS2 TaxID=1400762 RepID=A0A9P6C1G9_9AGAR|nr:hypothetical protein P691DRAFT_805422 [Macrolepiota fuliginosa MF-IS2]
MTGLCDACHRCTISLLHEPLVLSVFLAPSMLVATGGEDATSAKLEDLWLGLNAFEVLIRTLSPANEFDSAERCLWCTKPTTVLLSSQPHGQVVSAPWGITSPSESSRIFRSQV